MDDSIFFRLLETPVEHKGARLLDQVKSVNNLRPPVNVFIMSPDDFCQIERAPFAYWAGKLLRIYDQLDSLEPTFGEVIRGPELYSLEQSMRLWVEIDPKSVGPSRKWVYYAKGGELKPYAPDLHLVIDYASIRDGREAFRRPGDSSFYFKSGLTFTQRTTSRFTLRVLNADSLTSPKGPAIIPSQSRWLWYLMAVGNSILFQRLIELKVGAADAAARSYDLNILRDAPVPIPPIETQKKIEPLVQEMLHILRTFDLSDELAQAFQFPEFLRFRRKSLRDAHSTLQAIRWEQWKKLAKAQESLDNLVFELYGLAGEDPEYSEVGDDKLSAVNALAGGDVAPESLPTESQTERVESLLVWCVGVVLGRWDVRFVLEPSLLPKSHGPFDPTPPCSPGTLVGADGLPATRGSIASDAWLAARENVLDIPKVDTLRGESATIDATDYPLAVAWNGILVDDPTHHDDLVSRVRQVLNLVYSERAGAIEQEACQILGIDTLRDYFRDPRKGFFPFHIKRYSKSRRKAPIYWLLQSENRNYGVWLYIHRMAPDVLFTVGRDYADVKVNLEAAKLDELRQGLEGLEGTARKRREREVERQQKLVDEVTNFRNRIDEIAILRLPPDLNDGVVLSIAPLYPLVPWKEAKKYWKRLVAGDYEWSTMSQQMRQRGLVKKRKKKS